MLGFWRGLPQLRACRFSGNLLEADRTPRLLEPAAEPLCSIGPGSQPHSMIGLVFEHLTHQQVVLNLLCNDAHTHHSCIALAEVISLTAA